MKIWNPGPQQPLFFVVFVVVLTFSTPLIGFAQEAARSSDVLTAKANAERDARGDLNPYRWIGHGCLISCAGTGIACMATGDILTCIGVYLLTTSAAITEVYVRHPDPPPDRFIGKSPAYINIYVSTYKAKSAKSGRRRAKWAAAGCLGGTCINGGAMLAATVYIIETFGIRFE